MQTVDVFQISLIFVSLGIICVFGVDLINANSPLWDIGKFVGLVCMLISLILQILEFSGAWS